MYQTLKAAFDTEGFRRTLKDVCLVRQAHLAAASRKDPESAIFGLRTIQASHRFNAGVIEAMLIGNVPNKVIEEFGFHSFLFGGLNPALFEMMVLAISGVEEYSPEAFTDILKANQQVDVDAILRGEENYIDALLWMRHLGHSLAGYLVKCSEE